MKLLLLFLLAAVSYAAEPIKPVIINIPKEACRIEDGKLQAKSWEDCANGLLLAAQDLERQRDVCLKTPQVEKPTAVAPSKKGNTK